MSSQPNNKSKPLERDQVMLLIDLILKNPVITSKATNAANNRLKEEAWQTVAREFTEKVGETRRVDQLRLKWENLKKAARKRSAAIRQNNLKIDDGKNFIPADEVLDKVASMIVTTCPGSMAEFGGDCDAESIEITYSPAVEIGENTIEEPDDTSYTMDSQSELSPSNIPKSLLNKRRKLNEELIKARIEKELAVASYFRAKARNMELQNIRLENEIKSRQERETD